jgi:hypothetical protein
LVDVLEFSPSFFAEGDSFRNLRVYLVNVGPGRHAYPSSVVSSVSRILPLNSAVRLSRLVQKLRGAYFYRVISTAPTLVRTSTHAANGTTLSDTLEHALAGTTLRNGSGNYVLLVCDTRRKSPRWKFDTEALSDELSQLVEHGLWQYPLCNLN